MIDFIIQNKGTIIVLIILTISITLAIIKMKKKKGCAGGAADALHMIVRIGITQNKNSDAKNHIQVFYFVCSSRVK